MKMVSQSRAEKLAKLYEAANDVASIALINGELKLGDVLALGSALAAIDGGRTLTDPMQVLVGD